MMRVRLLYFASLRDAAGMGEETVRTPAQNLRALYAQLKVRHGFQMPIEHLRVAVDGAFADWNDGVCEGSEIAFIPPVSGG